VAEAGGAGPVTTGPAGAGLGRTDRGPARRLGTPSPFRMTVHDGVVELSGPSDPTDRRLATLLARGVPGVVEIRFTEE
jgi:hypothetical protein